MEWRTIIPNDDELAQLKVLRIDPAQYRFRASYRPGQPLSLSEWRTWESDASVIVNANFFDPEYRALGLVISDSDVHGLPYRDRGGTLVVKRRRGVYSLISLGTVESRRSDRPSGTGISHAGRKW